MLNLGRYDDPDDFAVRGEKEIKKFIKQNHRKFTMLQMCSILNITPGVVEDHLTRAQMGAIGSQPALSVLIVRDTTDYLNDVLELEEEWQLRH